jgi:hypothetical protein
LRSPRRRRSHPRHSSRRGRRKNDARPACSMNGLEEAEPQTAP